MRQDAEDAAILQSEAEEAGRATNARPATATTMAHISIAPPSTPAMPPPSTVPTQLATGGVIPKRPPPGLPSPPVTSGQDTYAPSALLTGAGSRDAGTTVLDTVLPGPAPAGGVSVSKPAPGYHFGYTHVNSLRGAEGSGMDILDSSAYQPMYTTVSAPPASIGYFPEGRRYLPTVAPLDMSHSHAHPVPTA